MGILQTARAGAGIGIAGIDDDRLRVALGYVLHTHLYGRGANLVGGEHSGCLGWHLGDNCGQIALLALVTSLSGA